MPKAITKIKLLNFRRFKSLALNFQQGRNLLIGDNESGKSSILQAIDLVLSASRSKVETLGLERLMNIDAVSEFLEGKRDYSEMPVLSVEIFLNEQRNSDLNGRNNSDGVLCDGLSLICSPVDEYSADIQAILADPEASFPFEYYTINYRTFAGMPFLGNRKNIRHLLLDSSQINNEYATREYVKNVYRVNSEDRERYKQQNEYRKHKANFRETVLSDLNAGLDTYQFSIANTTKSNLEADLSITEGDISIENKGKGRQCFIKTKFALQKKSAHPLDILLLEEPENHLSHTNMKRLVSTIVNAEDQQLIVTTHNSLISSRLGLRNAILLSGSCPYAMTLQDIPTDTANFFMKAPDNNVLEFVLSGKVLLVEGDAEYILMEALFKKITDIELDETNIHFMRAAA